MIAAPHLAVGAVAGLWGAKLAGGLVNSESELVQLAVQGGTAFFVAAVSHLVLDAIPHNEVIYSSALGKWPVLATELVIIFNVIFWICYARELNFLIVFLGMVGGAWLDCIHLLLDAGFPENFLLSAVMDFHNYCHSQHTPGPFPSLPIQILVAVVALIFLF